MLKLCCSLLCVCTYMCVKSWCMALGETSKQAGTKKKPKTQNKNKTVPLALERTDRSAQGESSLGGRGGSERNPGSTAPWPRAGARKERRIRWRQAPGDFGDTSKRSGGGEHPVPLPRRSGPPGSQSLNAAGVYELVVFLWDGSVQRRVLPAQKGPAAHSPRQRSTSPQGIPLGQVVPATH